MLIELNRFFTTEEVRREYRVPAAVADDILPKLPVVVTQEDGTRFHLETDVDEFLTEFSRQQRKAEARKNPLPKGRAGRSIETLEVAEYANVLRLQGKTWKEVLSGCKKRWPEDRRVRNVGQIRATWTRHFGFQKSRH